VTISAEIPYGAYWSTPFAKWQGSLGHLHSLRFAAHVTKAELARRNIAVDGFDHAVLGISVPQRHAFYGAPWLTGMIGAGDIGGPTLSQACATGVRCMLAAAQEIAAGLAENVLLVTCDRLSNGPHLYYPDPRGPGGTGESENWTMDNFGCDPLGRHAMIETAENVAKKHDISTAEQHDIALKRQAQYGDAVANDHAFHKRFMSLPFEVPDARFRKTLSTLDGDEGIFPSTAEGLAKLKPVMAGGTVTFGGQTHPADANAGMIVTTPERARDMASASGIRVRLLGFGSSRAGLALMPEAPVPAARAALDKAGLDFADMDAIKTHNPFALNDVLFSRQTGVDVDAMNNFGCSLIWGHPQAPMGTRSVIEVIEELALRGGGKGLFTGCAAGDTAMAVVLSVEDRG